MAPRSPLRTPLHPAFVALLVLPPVAGGCLGAEPDWDLVADIDTLTNGTRRVRNLGVGAWEQSRPWGLREDLRIGMGGGSEAGDIRDVAAILPDWEGNVYVLEWRSQEVRVFDSDGRPLRAFGGPGRGPGQLLGGAGLVWDPSGQLWTWDPVAHRYAVFGRDGTFVREVERPVLGVSYPWAGAVDWQWTLWDFGRLQTVYEPERGRLVESWVPVRIPMENGRPETLPPIVLTRALVGGRDEGPFTGLFTVAVDPAGYLWFGDPHDYRLFKRTPAGDTVVVATLPYEPRRVSERERDSVVAAFGATGVALLPESVPDAHPVIRRLVADEDGYLFVFVDVPGITRGSEADVFDSQGRYLGRLAFREPFELSTRPVIRGDDLYGEVRGPGGEPTVVRLHILR